MHNDFEPVVLHKYQSIAFAKLTLYTEGASFAQMSGSGSAVYGFFSDEKDVTRAVKRLSEQFKVFVTQPNFKP
ncbi:MAG: hypothetical protein HY800_07590 [Ignavibacteriales bacterium]|nr:hypothetical protein [Ignavibacteriales bacterium]